MWKIVLLSSFLLCFSALVLADDSFVADKIDKYPLVYLYGDPYRMVLNVTPDDFDLFLNAVKAQGFGDPNCKEFLFDRRKICII